MTSIGTLPQSTNDQVRRSVLEVLYRIHNSARSLKSARLSILELKRELRQLGLREQQIVSNLDYLIQSGWVLVEIEESEFRTPKGFTRRQIKEYYKISDRGISFFEEPSEFQRLEKSVSGINITNIQGVTVVGDQNIVVNTQYLDLYKNLSILSEVVRNLAQLSDREKLDNTKDIDTIKDQLSKPSPDKNIVKLAWEKLKPLATVAGIASFFKQAAELIGSLIL